MSSTKVAKKKRRESVSASGSHAHSHNEADPSLNAPFQIRIINSLTYTETKVTVTKKFTIREVQEAYAPYEDHPEYYLWTDMYGTQLQLEKTVVENLLVQKHETIEFDGLGKEPVIILIFKDGFEDERPGTLNPMLMKLDRTHGLCRNY